MAEVPWRLVDHPDRLRWNAKYAGRVRGDAHPLAVRALSLPPPDGPVLDLACGPSGAALLAAGSGRRVIAVDISDVALATLDAEARRRGLAGLITSEQADLREWSPREGGYALVLCTGYWDRAVFGTAVGAVAAGGVLAWEAFTTDARRVRPELPVEWCLAPGEPASLLPSGFTVIGTGSSGARSVRLDESARLENERSRTAEQALSGENARNAKRWLLARRDRLGQ